MIPQRDDLRRSHRRIVRRMAEDADFRVTIRPGGPTLAREVVRGSHDGAGALIASSQVLRLGGRQCQEQCSRRQYSNYS